MPDTTRIGLYGGTFDPPHNAHITLAESVLNTIDLDYIYFIPTAIHAFKDRKQITPQQIRYQMLETAIGQRPKFRISKIEFDRPSVSYTVDTLRSFCTYENIDRAFIYYIIGMDNFLEFSLWKEPEKILDLAHLLVMQRPGYTKLSADIRFSNRVEFLETPLFDISSTDIRKRISEGQPYKHLVPQGVAELIEKHNLYQTD